MGRNILEKEKIGSLPNVTIVQTALDELGLALTSCNYIWPPQLRSLYEQATKYLASTPLPPLELEYKGNGEEVATAT